MTDIKDFLHCQTMPVTILHGINVSEKNNNNAYPRHKVDRANQQDRSEIARNEHNELHDSTFRNQDTRTVRHEESSDIKQNEETHQTIPHKSHYIWMNMISIGAFHLVALYAVLNSLYRMMFYTFLWGLFLGGAGGFGVTGGVHRLWTHRSYKAKWPLRVILACCYSIAGQNTIFEWVRDHRVHHKFSETDADPHNANRGFFFAHVGWLMMKKHPEVLRKGRTVDMSDVINDPVVKIHTKLFTPLWLIFCFVIPILLPHYLWGETWYYSIMGPGIFRYILGLNFTWSVNSAAHIWGNKPYDRRIGPAENLSIAIVAMGEGWHNYHHVFPWDYKAAELGNYTFNLTTFWLDMFAKIGWAYDMKSASPELIRKIAEKHGDGSHSSHGHHEEVPPPDDNEEHVHYEVSKIVEEH